MAADGQALGARSGGLEHSDESELVARARVDPDAFAELYRRHYPRIARYVRRRLGCSCEADDAVAETFETALAKLDRYRDRGLPFRAWLYRLASRAVAGQATQARRRSAVSFCDSDSGHGSTESVDEAVGRADEIEQIRAALAQVEEPYQAALCLHYLEELPVAEVAQVQGVRVGTVKARLSRGRERLERILERKLARRVRP